jgi:hypothetical protein
MTKLFIFAWCLLVAAVVSVIRSDPKRGLAHEDADRRCQLRTMWVDTAPCARGGR